MGDRPNKTTGTFMVKMPQIRDMSVNIVKLDLDYLQRNGFGQEIKTESITESSTDDPKTQKNPLQCPSCQKTFFHAGNLKKHVHHVHKRNKRAPENREKRERLPCPYCDKSFATGSLERHIRIHTGDKPYRCEKCDKSYVDRTSLKFHETTPGHLNGDKDAGRKWSYSCEFCSKIFSGQDKLQRHVDSIHQDRRKITRVNNEGDSEDEEVENSNQIKYYKTCTSLEKLPCPICRKVIWKFNLNSHMRTHTGEKPYECDYCDKKFNNRSNFNRHLHRIHGKTREERPPVPRVSRKGIRNRPKLGRTEKPTKSPRKTTNSASKSKSPRKTTKSASKSKLHVKKSSGPTRTSTKAPKSKSSPSQPERSRYYSCKVCKKRFRTPRALISHGRAHATQYPCEYCKKKFFGRTKLIEHMFLHQTETYGLPIKAEGVEDVVVMGFKSEVIENGAGSDDFADAVPNIPDPEPETSPMSMNSKSNRPEIFPKKEMSENVTDIASECPASSNYIIKNIILDDEDVVDLNMIVHGDKNLADPLS